MYYILIYTIYYILIYIYIQKYVILYNIYIYIKWGQGHFKLPKFMRKCCFGGAEHIYIYIHIIYYIYIYCLLCIFLLFVTLMLFSDSFLFKYSQRVVAQLCPELESCLSSHCCRGPSQLGGRLRGQCCTLTSMRHVLRAPLKRKIQTSNQWTIYLLKCHELKDPNKKTNRLLSL